MENMQNLAAALHAPGVKTCLACGKAGAKSLCMGCRSVNFCGKACQTQAWPGHKKECRRIKKERARVVDKAAADYAADEARAADFCRPNIPKGAECYICLNQIAPGQLRGDLVRGCVCRGPHTGFVHIRCLVKYAEEKGEHDDHVYQEAMLKCTQCRQEFQGPIMVALQRVQCLRYADRAETDLALLNARKNLGASLDNVGRLDEALIIKEEYVASMRRLHGPDSYWTITAKERVAQTLARQGFVQCTFAVDFILVGGTEKLTMAVEMLTLALRLKYTLLGETHEESMETEGQLAYMYRVLGRHGEAVAMLRLTLPKLERAYGRDHMKTLNRTVMLCQTLIEDGFFSEAADLYDSTMPRLRRILGPDHYLTSQLECCRSHRDSFRARGWL